MEKNNAYYYKVVERMDIDDFRAQIKIKENERLFEENYFNEFLIALTFEYTLVYQKCSFYLT